MYIISAIFIGFVVGLIARAIKPGADPMGFWLTAILGVVGSVVATLIGRAAGWYLPGEPAGFLASLIGAVIVLAVWAGLPTNKKGGTTNIFEKDRRAA